MDSKTLLHLARALAGAGNIEESQAVMDRFRQAGPEKRSGVRSGFVEYLALSDEQRHADYRARLEKAVQSHPQDAALQVEYLKLLLVDGDLNHAAALAHTIAAMKPSAALLDDAGHALLATRQYPLAHELLQQAQASNSSAAIELDLAIATFREGDRAKALQLLARIPESERHGDYYLGRAEMLDEDLSDVHKAIVAEPQRPDLYQRAAALMLAKDRTAGALDVLDQGVRAIPGNREIALMQAAAAELAGKSGAAEKSLVEIQNRWPEWTPVWEAHALILAAHGRAEEARKALETAAALGSQLRASPEIIPYLRNLILAGPGRKQ
jgi:Flp pilus assembly protein TadD